MAVDPNNPFAHLIAPPASAPAPTPRAPATPRPLPTPQLIVPRGVGPTETPEYREEVAYREAQGRQRAEDQAKQRLSAEGKARFAKSVNFLRNKYKALNSRGEMISAKNSMFDNLSNWAEAQAVQVIGNPTGSINQSDRESIINQRNILIPLLLEATGASARMIDSNAEAQRFLQALTGPTQSYETVMDSLDNVEALFGAAVKSLRGPTNGEPLLPEGRKFTVKRRK